MRKNKKHIGPGRPTDEDETEVKIRCVSFGKETEDLLKAIGNGNISAGIRRAARDYVFATKWSD